MSKVDELAELENLESTSAVESLNTNFGRITTAFQNTISRDGSTPNSMGANFDMGSHRIINLAAPVDANDAVRKTDLDAATGGLDDSLITLITNAPTYAEQAFQYRNEAEGFRDEAESFIGAATSAAKWTTARTLTLGGDLTGNVTFDGSASFTLTGTVANGAITSSKLASGAAVSNIGYTPVNKAGDTVTGDLIINHSWTSLDQFSVGFRGIPINPQNNDYTLVLLDSGKCIAHASATPHTWTIPLHSSVDYPVGTVITFRNYGSGAITIAPTSGVALRIAGSGSSGNKTLAQWGLASMLCEADNEWVITGVGIS